MSSLCPLPIGTIASTAFKPICTGWSTDCRAITPGATTSTGDVLSAFISPLPSIGVPKVFTTLPNKDSPTGTSKTFPVHVAFCPSIISR